MNPLFSIIIPCRNESLDIANTIEACLLINYEPKEIIIVDDSTDDTPSIVAQYRDRGVCLIHREKNSNGCCGARNMGMKEANGEFIMLLNADDLPNPDFLDQVMRHYNEGADYVVVQSAVANCTNKWARYLRAIELSAIAGDEAQEWSEGFTCRRSAVEKVGYIPGDFPIPFCRDWMLGAALGKVGFKKVIDRSIVMNHVTAHEVHSFWKNQVWRATMWAPSSYYFMKRSIAMILTREIFKSGWRIIKGVLLIPHIRQAIRYSKLISGTSKETASMLLVRYVQDFAFTVGAFKGIINLREMFK